MQEELPKGLEGVRKTFALSIPDPINHTSIREPALENIALKVNNVLSTPTEHVVNTEEIRGLCEDIMKSNHYTRYGSYNSIDR